MFESMTAGAPARAAAPTHIRPARNRFSVLGLYPGWLRGRPTDEELVPDAPERIREASEFGRTFDPEAGADLWFTDYAVKACEEAIRNAEYADTKAEKLIGFIGALTAIVVAILSKDAGVVDWRLPLLATPAVACALASVRMALLAHAPASQYDLPDIENAVKYIPFFRERARSAFIGKLHWTRECQRITCEAKAALLSQAYRWGWLALLLLVLPLVLASLPPAGAPR
ncbi:MAG: hypothetical protein Q7L55_06045 [Actinomycetota bacterium]|nr:hypothetical protein [Actinomycetota bacterium]